MNAGVKALDVMPLFINRNALTIQIFDDEYDEMPFSL
jgi:hypothetical protein